MNVEIRARDFAVLLWLLRYQDHLLEELRRVVTTNTQERHHG
jgi:hypothetical protein